MKKTLELTLPPEIAYDEQQLQQYLLSHLLIKDHHHFHVRLLKRSIDARSRNIKVNLQADVYIDETPEQLLQYNNEYKDVSNAKQAIIVGAGPAGLFAALRLIELGIKPIIIERGKDVQERRRDLANINKKNIVNENSNYCFGEGGAGTYSDGKLYTRSKKRGDIRRILEIMVAHGAAEEILYEAHPHIGTNKLPKLIQEIRQTILQYGGEIHFNTKVVDFVVENLEVKGVITESASPPTTPKGVNAIDALQSSPSGVRGGIGVILATGHSARDIFELLHQRNILIEAKPFALGVRIEHQQSLIDSIQYKCIDRGIYLPAASYSLVEQVKTGTHQKGVFSFCMCPGGFIVPSATNQNEIVVNGMSPSKRDSPYSNSGMVVAVDETDWKNFNWFGPLAAMEYQKAVEQKAWQIAGQTQTAPAQRMQDFVNKKISSSLLETSYQPGLVPMEMRDFLPKEIAFCLQEAFKSFGNKMRGYLTNEAQIIGVESRTSSPVKIPRDKETLEHVSTKRLFPCAEGAGYAGGIMSAAMDGERCAEALVKKYTI
ncbi:MAG: FAD-dependent monooxygenase [Sphingobacteriales bacterium]|nr:FAD-dependent monooxygenase [Sphingobacteriales bacterium]